MFLKFKDRTWILLGKLIDKGEKEGVIKHIEIPIKEWNMLRSEWQDLSRTEQKAYIVDVKVTTEGDLPVIGADFTMEKDFVDKWIEGEYNIYYRGVKLVPDGSKRTFENEEKAKAETEKLG